MKLLILAAGYAVRLQPLTLNTPKPLLPVGGKKMIDRIIEKTEALKNIDGVHVVSNRKFFHNFVVGNGLKPFPTSRHPEAKPKDLKTDSSP